MSEPSHRRTYYRKRILIESARILAPQFDDGLLCITGAQIEMLRNLMPYLKRRSTFVSSYQVGHYFIPNDADWDDIQAIVADLEETLMGCTEIATALNNIAAQLACICQGMGTASVQTQPQDDGYSGQQQYDDYISDVEEDVGGVPGGFPSWAAWKIAKCKGAQRLIDDIISATTDIGMRLTSGILITFTLLNGLLLLTVITAPISMVLQLAITMVAIAANYVYEEVTGWLITHKQSLVCEIYLSETTSEAHQRITAYINDHWSVASSNEPTKQMFNWQTLSSIFDGTMRDYTDWEGDYSETYCTTCVALEEDVEFTWTWPPCPGAHFQDGGVCENSRLCFNGDVADAHQQHIVTAGTWNQVTLECRFRSKFGAAWTVGWLSVERWDTGLDDWVQEAALPCNTTVAAGQLNTSLVAYPKAPPAAGGLYRAVLEGADGQHDSSPYPLQVEYARVKYETV